MVFAFCVLSAILLTNSLQVAKAVAERQVDDVFELEAKVVYHYASGVKKFILNDDTGLCEVHAKFSSERLSSYSDGDIIWTRGRIEQGMGTDSAFAVAQDVRRLSEGEPSLPDMVTAKDVAEGRCQGRLVSIRGTIIDAFRDELDVNFAWLVLRLPDGDALVAVPGSNQDLKSIDALVDAQVSLTGFGGEAAKEGVGRRFLGCFVMTRDLNSIEIQSPPPQNPFYAEPADRLIGASALQLLRSGKRRVEGHVLAVWSGNKMLVRCASGCLHDVELADGLPPSYGEYVEVVGFPETDLHKINLSRARWRRLDVQMPFAEPLEEERNVHDIILFSRLGTSGIDMRYHGRRLKLTGTVERMPALEDVDRSIGLRCGKDVVPIGVQACPEVLNALSVGCTVSVVGTFILRTENCKPNVVLPRVTGCMLVLCRPHDVIVLRHTPWWTVRNLVVIIASLLAVLIGSLVWNRILGRIVERRGRELLRTRVAHDEADLKMEERTRLAVELHDTIAQELTGVSMMIDAARLAMVRDPADAIGRLDSAAHRMRVCRKDLRNCLWDLRNRPFDRRSLADAVREACGLVIGDACLEVVCPIACHDLLENKIHGILCIVRELVVNAVRHGRASVVRVAITRKDDGLSVRVTDNGTGFNPNCRLGPNEGHFGILGVTERAGRLGGTAVIQSSPGQGTCVTVDGLNCEL